MAAWKLDQAKRLKELEKENAKLKRVVAGAVAGEAGSQGYCGGENVSS